MQKFKKNIFLIIGVLLMLLIIIPMKLPSNNVLASDGVLDLNNYNFSQDKNIELRGQWDLYYNQLLSPNEINDESIKSHYNIPGRLCDQVPNAVNGYMTLHLKIQVPKDDIYGIYIPSMFTSSHIWINNKEYGGHGRVGKNIKEEKAIYRPIFLYFPSENRQIDIVIQTSVYRDIQPRLSPSILGTQDNIMKLSYLNVAVDGITLGILFIMCILNLGFYFAKPHQKRHLYFSIVCIIISLRCLVYNSRILSEFFPNMHFEVISKIAAITFFLWVTFYVLFLSDVFKNKILIKKPAVFFGFFFTALTIFTDSLVYDSLAILAQVFTLTFSLYLFIFLLKELKLKNKSAKLNFIPFITISITAINDMLVNNSVIFNSYSSIYGGVLFVLSQSVFIITDYINNIKKLDNINKDPLTSLYNNKYIKKCISSLIDKYNYNDETFSLLMIDVDNFKSINDTYGHLFGDKVLVDVANILYEVSKFKGYAGRFGGDEFVIILPNCNEEDSLEISYSIINKINLISDSYKIPSQVSVSIGAYENTSTTVEECMNNADNAMYYSKTNGKNQVNNSKAIV